MGIEILEASEKFNILKPDFRNIKNFEASLEINEENIKLTMNMGIFKRNNLINTSLNALTLNSMNIPSSMQGIAVTC
jgi:hypothetical protein